MEAEITKELIFDHLSNCTTPLQHKQIEEWLSMEENEELFYRWLEEWEKINPEYLPNSDLLIQKYQTFFQQHPNKEISNLPSSKNESLVTKRDKYLRLALVSCFLILLGSVLWQFRLELLHKRYQTSFGEVKSFFLSEGTKVTLNANSSLQVPRWGFGKYHREVFLNGEAYFSVTHQSNNQKFIVKTLRNFEVVVLGTEFSVFSRNRGGKIILNKGKIKINYQKAKSKKTLHMNPGDIVAFDEKNQISKRKLSGSQNQSSWKEKRFIFQETPFTDIALLLYETYGLEVYIDSTLKQQKLMGSFRAENADEFIEAISELLDIQFYRDGNKIRFTE